MVTNELWWCLPFSHRWIKKLRWLHRHRRLWHYKYVLVTTENKRKSDRVFTIFAHIKNKPNRRLNGFDLVIWKKFAQFQYCQHRTFGNRKTNTINVLRLAYGRQAASINLTTVIKHEKQKLISYFSRTFDLALSFCLTVFPSLLSC